MKIPRSLPVLRAARRARWLAEVATALEDAGNAALRLAIHAQDSSEALLLGAQIASLRDEVESIRLGRAQFTDETHPDRMK